MRCNYITLSEEKYVEKYNELWAKNEGELFEDKWIYCFFNCIDEEDKSIDLTKVRVSHIYRELKDYYIKDEDNIDIVESLIVKSSNFPEWNIETVPNTEGEFSHYTIWFKEKNDIAAYKAFLEFLDKKEE